MANYLSYVSIFSVLIPVIIGIYFFKRLSKLSRIIWLTSVAAAVPQTVRFVPFMDGNRMLFYNIYSIAEMVLYILFFRAVVGKYSKTYRVSIIFSVVFIILFIALTWFRDIRIEFFHEVVCIINLYVAAMVMKYYYRKVLTEGFDFKNEKVTNCYMIGLFVYAPVTVLIYALWDFLQLNQESRLQSFWVIHHIANIFMYSIFAIGIYIGGNREKSNSFILKPA